MTDEPDCPGEGRCHGPMKWCDECGDVGDVCDAGPPTVIQLDDGYDRVDFRGSCHCHYCSTCYKKGKLSDMTCWNCELHEDIEKWEGNMLRAEARGDSAALGRAGRILESLRKLALA